MELKKLVVESRKGDMIKEYTKDLTDVDAEKLATLAEGIEFTSEKQFKDKIKVLKENCFARKVKKGTQEHLVEDTIGNPVGLSKPLGRKVMTEMDIYSEAITRTIK